MNPPGQPAAVHPPLTTTAVLMRGLCEKIEHDLSHLAWLLAGQPDLLPPSSLENLLKLNTTIHEIERHLRK